MTPRNRRSLAGLVIVALLAAGAADAQTPWQSAEVLGETIAPGQKWLLSWVSGETFTGSPVPIPVRVARGFEPGPTLCLTAGIHGDELNGIEVVRRILQEIDPSALRGMVIGVPIVNLHGFRQASRYLPDRRDLNRHFPGRANGSAASRIARSFFEQVIAHCDTLVDLHTGSFHRSNVPQVRADLTDSGAFELAKDFGSGVVVHAAREPGTLRHAAGDVGIPAISYEAGEPMRFQPAEVDEGVRGVRELLARRGMLSPRPRRGQRQEIYYRARWVRVDDGGILISDVELGDAVKVGDVLGVVTDPISNERSIVKSPYDGRVLGMALNQVVIPGFAAFHVGIRGDDYRVLVEEPAEGQSLEPDAGSSEPATEDQLDVDERPE
ncbi:MAG TPA: succinylglutamate desuccinylase/aspartoacylase family protein [Myxococcota bacterium]